jgi:hypothetical protein
VLGDGAVWLVTVEVLKDRSMKYVPVQETCRAFGAAWLDLRLRSLRAFYFTVTWMLLLLLVSLLSVTT